MAAYGETLLDIGTGHGSIWGDIAGYWDRTWLHMGHCSIWGDIAGYWDIAGWGTLLHMGHCWMGDIAGYGTLLDGGHCWMGDIAGYGTLLHMGDIAAYGGTWLHLGTHLKKVSVFGIGDYLKRSIGTRTHS